MKPLFSTARLHYAQLDVEHAAGPYLAWLHDPQVIRYLAAPRRRHWDEPALRAYIAAVNANPAVLLLGLFLKEDGRHIGNIKLEPIEWEHSRANIGLMIGDKSLWGQGYAAEGLRGVCDYAFRALRLHKVYATCNSANKASVAAFVKAGYQREGARAQHCYADGAWYEQILFAVFCGQNQSPLEPIVPFPTLGQLANSS